jgi:hypothetical protein
MPLAIDPDAGVAALVADDPTFALVLDRGQLELLAQNVSQLVQRDVDLQNVLAGVLSRLTRAVPFGFLASDAVADVALPLTDPAALLFSEREARDVDLRDRNRHHVLALAAEHFALRDVAAQVLPDLAAYDAAEPRVILIDLQRHLERPSLAYSGSQRSGAQIAV